MYHVTDMTSFHGTTGQSPNQHKQFMVLPLPLNLLRVFQRNHFLMLLIFLSSFPPSENMIFQLTSILFSPSQCLDSTCMKYCCYLHWFEQISTSGFYSWNYMPKFVRSVYSRIVNTQLYRSTPDPFFCHEMTSVEDKIKAGSWSNFGICHGSLSKSRKDKYNDKYMEKDKDKDRQSQAWQKIEDNC